jgi:hypothetical protein
LPTVMIQWLRSLIITKRSLQLVLIRFSRKCHLFRSRELIYCGCYGISRMIRWRG